MTPFDNPLTPEERRFNRQHAANRVIVENAFGQLKRRFPMLRYGVRTRQADMIPAYISACFILHNVAKRLADPDFDDEFFEEEEEPINIPDDLQNDQQIRLLGRQRRNEIASLLHD